tara:strand:+ start:582 stop:1406 length:825 start_codon:yes stop_codon:yes gene_type:complete
MQILSFIAPCLPRSQITRRRSTIKNLKNPFPGAEVGIPLLLFENIFTNIHYSYDITTIEIVFLQFAFAFLTYGFDRFKDSYDLLETNKDKQELYQYYREHKTEITFSLIGVYLIIVYLLGKNQETIPFLIAISSTFSYKDFKSYLGPSKPIYVAVMWTSACYLLPCVINDGDYSSLKYPLDYLPIFLTLFGSSNIADSKDIIEDNNNNITTIPILIGEENSNTLSVFCILLSSLLFFINPNFHDRDIINSVYAVQNTILGVVPIAMNSTIIKLP